MHKAGILLKETILDGRRNWHIKGASYEGWFDPAGGGLSKLVDSLGNDWISFVPGDPPVCYRGIPNIQTDSSGRYTGLFHPGYDTVHSEITDQNQQYIAIHSTTGEHEAWSCSWVFGPDSLKCTVETGESPGFAFLYEGTPGGAPFDAKASFIQYPDGRKTSFANKPDAKIHIPKDVAPTVVSFGKEGYPLRLVYAYHGAPTGIAHYSVYDALTVFGFGRECEPGITAFPARFLMYFTETAQPKDLRTAIGNHISKTGETQ